MCGWLVKRPTQRHRLNYKVWRRCPPNHAPKPRPEPTAWSAVRGRREAPSVAVAAAAVAAAAVVVAAAVAKILFCHWVVSKGRPCSRDGQARF